VHTSREGSVPSSLIEEAQLHVAHEMSGHRAHIWLGGELGHSTRGELDHLVQELVACGVRTFVLDCKHLDFLDLDGLAPILALHDQARRGGGRLEMHHVSPLIGRWLRAKGLHDLVAPDPSVA
jgi:anti-anti-sigma factor